MERSHKIAVLDRALELLGPKGEHWVQGFYFARFEDGSFRRVPAEEANAWCLAGACGQAAHEMGISRYRDGVSADAVVDELSLSKATRELHGVEVAKFNDDSTSFRAIRNLVKNYIATLKGEQT
jgi:hypothetical protein